MQMTIFMNKLSIIAGITLLLLVDIVFGNDAPLGPVTVRYAVVVSISKFQDNRINIRYAQNDAADFYSYLVNPLEGNFKKEDISRFVNEKATR